MELKQLILSFQPVRLALQVAGGRAGDLVPADSDHLEVP